MYGVPSVVVCGERFSCVAYLFLCLLSLLLLVCVQVSPLEPAFFCCSSLSSLSPLSPLSCVSHISVCVFNASQISPFFVCCFSLSSLSSVFALSSLFPPLSPHSSFSCISQISVSLSVSLCCLAAFCCVSGHVPRGKTRLDYEKRERMWCGVSLGGSDRACDTVISSDSVEFESATHLNESATHFNIRHRGCWCESVRTEWSEELDVSSV